jgi:glycosyltransferase involved in cell wall biosynthesis
MISFIVPAHNEQSCLGRTLPAIHEAARSTGLPYEIIVVNDASTDATAEIARQHHATVLTVNHRQIAATRNSGGRAAQGDRLFFVDADTTINPRVVAAALQRMDQGAVGGGAPVRFEGAVPLYVRLLLRWLGIFGRLSRISGGAFMFCTREAFRATGGFDERLFGAEDAVMSWALQRQGRFVLLWRTVLTSGRRVRGIRGLQTMAALVRAGFFPSMLTRRSSVKKIWYDSNREDDDTDSRSLAVLACNTILLLIILVVITDPIFGFIPWLRTHIGPFGPVRFAINIFLCHVGLVLWPIAWLICCSLFQQQRWLERIKVIALLALCVWLAWDCTQSIIWFWPWLCHQLLHFYNR